MDFETPVNHVFCIDGMKHLTVPLLNVLPLFTAGLLSLIVDNTLITAHDYTNVIMP